MSDTATLNARASASLFGRFLAALDRALMTCALIAVRNGEPPYFGL
jgi:hypothetical protein